MKPKEQPRHNRRSTLLLLAAIAMIPLALLATTPSWWTTYGVLNGNPPNDFAAAAQGQAKNFAVEAVSELDNDIPQFGGSELDSLATTLLSGTATAQDFSAVNLGQLKALTQPFYARLLTMGYYGPPLNSGTAMTSGTYPWIVSGLTANDYAMGNLGQVKFLFSFDVTYSSYGIGIPDWWIRKYFPTSTMGGLPWVNPSAADPAGDGLTNLQAFEAGTNPVLGAAPDTGGVVNLEVFTPSE